jgi:hypothetical protein
MGTLEDLFHLENDRLKTYSNLFEKVFPLKFRTESGRDRGKTDRDREVRKERCTDGKRERRE